MHLIMHIANPYAVESAIVLKCHFFPPGINGLKVRVANHLTRTRFPPNHQSITKILNSTLAIKSLRFIP